MWHMTAHFKTCGIVCIEHVLGSVCASVFGSFLGIFRVFGNRDDVQYILLFHIQFICLDTLSCFLWS